MEAEALLLAPYHASMNQVLACLTTSTDSLVYSKFIFYIWTYFWTYSWAKSGLRRQKTGQHLFIKIVEFLLLLLVL
jgi:hypothetical protein